MWDVDQYERFRSERARPFFDLCARIPGAPRSVVDLGCGTGETTATLLERWPEARILGMDSSADMIAAAGPRAVPGKLAFAQADIREWEPPGKQDLLLSNATLHWVPEHGPLLARLASYLNPGGVIAVQMPNNFEAPSFQLLGEHRDNGAAVMPLGFYAETLLGLGFRVDAWETIYLQVLAGDDAVLEWMKGTTIRPILTRLDEAARAAFLASYGAKLREAYPKGPHGTLFPFRRLFFVAQLGH